MSFTNRIRQACIASGIHFIASCALAILASAVVFLVWYPYPYRELSGGRELFFLVVSVDVVCGPLLTMVLFNPAKPKTELWRDMALVVLIQLGALGYGLWTVWQARPLYLVLEIDRFKVVTRPVIDESKLAALPPELAPKWWMGPITVGIREPKDRQEQEKVMFEAVQGGRDYAERPEFYLPYAGAVAAKSLLKAKPIEVLLAKYPAQRDDAMKIARAADILLSDIYFLPVVARKDWVVLIDKQGAIKGFLPGNGF
jgi:hypothetical protein